jgi:two-component system, OmpR family, phosphate regulon sensor histidine kinase PhoR
VPASLLWNVAPSYVALQAAVALLLAAVALSFLLLWRAASQMTRLREILRRMAAGELDRASAIESRANLGPGLSALVQAIQENTQGLQAAIRSLTEERNRSAAIMRSMAEGIAVVDAGERIVFCNEAFAATWNMAAGGVEGKSAVEVIRLPDIIELIRRALQGEEGLHGEISTGGTVRPQSFFVSVAPVPAFDRETKPAAPAAEARYGAVVVMHEITELRRLEQVRKDFVANVSHELRTPLTAIHGFAETLLAGALKDQNNNRRFIEIIRDHSARLSRLTDDLLKLSRIEAGKLEFDLQPVELRDLVTLEEEGARAAAAKKGLSLCIQPFPAKIKRVRGDASLLREVLRNLLDNAIQYTAAGGQISVSADANGEFAILTVTDTGIGIPKAEQSRIFERFYRVDDARSREAGGTGLGLAIAKHVVESHGGKIWVESAVGEGSKFHFSMPLAR